MWSQIAALSHELDTAYLLVEGSGLDSARGITARGVRGALLQILDNDIRLIQTHAPNDSALWLCVMAARAQVANAGRRHQRRGRRRTVVTPAGVLATIPGISPATARRLIHRFGSVAGVAAAREAELREIVGIGAVRAESLTRVLRSSSDETIGHFP